MPKSRNAMLAMAELYTRSDDLLAEIDKIDRKVDALNRTRAAYAAEREAIGNGIEAIGVAARIIRRP